MPQINIPNIILLQFVQDFNNFEYIKSIFVHDNQ